MALDLSPGRRAGAVAVATILCGFGTTLMVHAADAGPQRIFQCTLPDGRKVTSDKPIAECMNAGKPQRELNKDGSERGVVEAPLTADEKAEREQRLREAEAARAATAIAVRRDRELLGRFPNEAAHAKAREKAMDDVRNSMRISDARIALLQKERKPLLDEAEFYPAKQLPGKLKAQLDANDASLEAQKALQQTQQTEIGRINDRFDAELARLKKLWAGAPLGSLGPMPGASASAPAPAPAKSTSTQAPAGKSPVR
jgi:hypothetical protein